MKKVLIIGGTGTISQPIAKKLSSRPDVDLYLLNRGSKPAYLLSVKGKSCWSVISRMLRGKEIIVHGDGQSVGPPPLLKALLA